MRIQLDNIFVAELKKNGYDVDYKKLVAMYQESRKHPVVQRRKKENERINRIMFGTK